MQWTRAAFLWCGNACGHLPPSAIPASSTPCCRVCRDGRYSVVFYVRLSSKVSPSLTISLLLSEHLFVLHIVLHTAFLTHTVQPSSFTQTNHNRSLFMSYRSIRRPAGCLNCTNYCFSAFKIQPSLLTPGTSRHSLFLFFTLFPLFWFTLQQQFTQSSLLINFFTLYIYND